MCATKIQEDEAVKLISRLKEGTWFRFAEVDIEIPQRLWMKFEEMPPFFFTKRIPDEAVPQHMKDYMELVPAGRGALGKKLDWGSLCSKAAAVCPVCCSGMSNHGAKITAVYRTIDYQATKALKWFVDEVTEAQEDRRRGQEQSAVG